MSCESCGSLFVGGITLPSWEDIPTLQQCEIAQFLWQTRIELSIKAGTGVCVCVGCFDIKCKILFVLSYLMYQ